MLCLAIIVCTVLASLAGFMPAEASFRHLSNQLVRNPTWDGERTTPGIDMSVLISPRTASETWRLLPPRPDVALAPSFDRELRSCARKSCTASGDIALETLDASSIHAMEAAWPDDDVDDDEDGRSDGDRKR